MDLNCTAHETIWPFVGCEFINFGVPLAVLIVVIAYHIVTTECDVCIQAVKIETTPSPEQAQTNTPHNSSRGYAGCMEHRRLLNHPVHQKIWLSASFSTFLFQMFITLIFGRWAVKWVHDSWFWDTGHDWIQQFFKPYVNNSQYPPHRD